MSKITRIRFSARFQVDDRSEVRVEQADFKLGNGPCGKEVAALDYTVTDTTVRILQTCTDGEQKQFVYPLTHLTGRIELTYGD